MTQRQALYAIGGVFGGLLLVSFAIPEFAGIGPEIRAYPSRLARAKALGLDPGVKNLLAREAAKPVEKRQAFDELERFLRDPRRFDLARPANRLIPPGAPVPLPGAIPVSTGNTKPRPLESYRADLRRLGELSRAAEGGSHMDWAKGYMLLFPSYAPIKGSANVADALARADATKGSYAEATRNLLDAADVWRAYGSDPVIIGDLVRTTHAAVILRGAGRLLAHPSYPASEARRLLAMAEGPNLAQTVPTREFMLLEGTMAHDLLDKPDTFQELQGVSSGADRSLEYGMRFQQVRRAWQSDTLRLVNDAVSRLPADPYDFDGIKNVLATYEREATAPRGLRGKYIDVVGMVYSAFADAQRKREASRRVLILATALRSGESETAARKRLGRFALDPYDGKPLRLRAAVETPYWLTESPSLPVAPRLRAVYSIGSNRKDDGGRTVTKSDQGDIVLVIPR